MRISYTLIIASLCITPLAHAGVYEFINGVFTFREDQKDRVAPNRTLPPKIIQTPNFDVTDQRAWNAYYTQPNLAPRDYLNGSASKVMRPATDIPPSQRLGYQPATQPQATQIAWQQPQPHQRPVNQQRIAISEPHTKPNTYQATKIDRPVRSWRDGPGELTPTPRPGDFDYQAANDPTAQQNQIAGGRPQARIEFSEPQYNQHRAIQPMASLADPTGRRVYQPERYVQNHTQPQQHSNFQQLGVYKVQRGDTLSTISDQPQIYNDWSKWPLIWDANRGTVKDPDLLYKDQHLGIPRNYTRAQEADAQYRARNRGGHYSLSDGQ